MPTLIAEDLLLLLLDDDKGTLAQSDKIQPLLGGALAPILTGIIAQKWSFVPALLAAAAIAFAGAMAYLLLVRKPIPEQAANAASRPLPA